jgi:hypothetical protein
MLPAFLHALKAGGYRIVHIVPAENPLRARATSNRPSTPPPDTKAINRESRRN